MKNLADYKLEVEDELGRTVLSPDGARNLVDLYVNKCLTMFYAAYPYTWLLTADGDASNDVALSTGEFRKSFPANTLDVRTISLILGTTSSYVLGERTPEWMDRHYPDIAGQAAQKPVCWATVSPTQFVVAPKADSAYTLRLRRTQMPSTLSGATLSIVPTHFDQVIVEGATALGFRRLRMWEAANERWGAFVEGIRQAIVEDKEQPGLEQPAEVWQGPGGSGTLLPPGDYWAMPDVRYMP